MLKINYFRGEVLKENDDVFAKVPLARKDGHYNTGCDLIMKQIALLPELLEGCKQLINALHFEHFAARLNDEEIKGLDAIKNVLNLLA